MVLGLLHGTYSVSVLSLSVSCTSPGTHSYFFIIEKQRIMLRVVCVYMNCMYRLRSRRKNTTEFSSSLDRIKTRA